MSFASGIGLASGIDFNAIIQQTRAVNSRPISIINVQKNNLLRQQDALGGISRLLAGFRTAAEGLQDLDGFFSFSSSSSNSQIASASASGDALEGAYSVQVKQLAKADRIAAQGVATLDATAIAPADGTFEFALGDNTSKSVELTAGDTLQDLVDKINGLENTDVTASIINDGSSTNPYRLVLTSSKTGAENAIEVLTNDTTLNFSTNTIEAAAAETDNQFNGTATSSGTYTGTTSKQIVVEITSAGAVGAAGFRVSYDGGVTFGAADEFTAGAAPVALADGVEIAFGAGTQDFAIGDRFSIDAFNPRLQKATNAIIEVDGIQVQRDTNSFTDVVEGVTINANKVDEDAATITVRRNTGGIAAKLNEFIEAYNSLVDDIARVGAYDVENQQAAVLFGDSTVRNLATQLRGELTRAVPGIGDLNTLSSIGVTIDGSGKLSLDSTILNEALDEDPEAVRALFVESGNSTTSSVSLLKSSDATETGDYSVQITQAAERAAVSGTQTLVGPLAADERLTIVDGENATVAVQLTAGMTLDQIVDKLNAELSDNDVQVQASNDNGQLKLTSSLFGSDAYFRVRSDQAAATVGQLGIGTTNVEDYGVDVAGTINGVAANGEGQNLAGIEGSASEGLELLITALGPTSATLTLSRGIADSLVRTIEELTDSDSGMFAARDDRINSQIEDFDARIDELEDRLDQEAETMRARFTALEVKLSQLQQQGSFLNAQLASLIGS